MPAVASIQDNSMVLQTDLRKTPRAEIGEKSSKKKCGTQETRKKHSPDGEVYTGWAEKLDPPKAGCRPPYPGPPYPGPPYPGPPNTGGAPPNVEPGPPKVPPGPPKVLPGPP